MHTNGTCHFLDIDRGPGNRASNREVLPRFDPHTGGAVLCLKQDVLIP